MPARAAPHPRPPAGTEVTLRVLFAAEPADEPRVRHLVDEALARGWGDDPDGVRTTGSCMSPAPRRSSSTEQDHARRLTRS